MSGTAPTPPTGPMPRLDHSDPTAPVPEDEGKLCWALGNLIGIPTEALIAPTEAGHQWDRLVQFLITNKIFGLERFLQSAHEDIVSLEGPISAPTTTTAAVRHAPLELHQKSRLRLLRAFYHRQSRIDGEAHAWVNDDIAVFNNFRTSEYNPEDEIIPWNRPLKHSPTITSAEISQWQRQVRPDKNHYPKFTNEEDWITWKENFLTVAMAHGTLHLLEHPKDAAGNDILPSNPELDKAQRDWMFMVMFSVIECPSSKVHVLQGLKDHDTRKIWKE